MIGKEFDGEVLVFQERVKKHRWKYWGWFLLAWTGISSIGYGTFHLLFGYYIPQNSAIYWGMNPAAAENLIPRLFALGLLEGSIIGFLQWIVLRQHLIYARRWIVVTALGYGIGVIGEGLFLGILKMNPDAIRAIEWWAQSNLGWDLGNIFFYKEFTSLFVRFFIVAIIQTWELRVWFYNSYFWVFTALPLAYLRPFTIFVGQALNRIESGLIMGAFTGLIMVYFLQREYEIAEDERLEELENTAPS